MGLISANLLYIDPATVSIIATSISGIIIAGSVTALILWRKFKKGVTKVFKIDENKNKEVEEEVVVTEDETCDTDNKCECSSESVTVDNKCECSSESVTTDEKCEK